MQSTENLAFLGIDIERNRENKSVSWEFLTQGPSSKEWGRDPYKKNLKKKFKYQISSVLKYLAKTISKSYLEKHIPSIGHKEFLSMKSHKHKLIIKNTSRAHEPTSPMNQSAETTKKEVSDSQDWWYVIHKYRV